MIVRCPGCTARYRLDEARIPGEEAKLRCPKCQALFIVRAPAPSLDDELPAPASSSVSRAGASPRPPESSLPSHQAPPTALLADEPREFRDFVAGVLAEAGFGVGLTDNGEEALFLAESHRFDLILLNVYLRRMLGINVCERIKSMSALRDTPVILMGAVLRPEEGGLSRGLYGADDFLSTSVSRGELLGKIRHWSRAGSGPLEESLDAPSIPVDRPVLDEPSAQESEIRRLARIMVSDIQMYHPEKFNRSLREGNFFESFAQELAKGKEIIDDRFGDIPNRIQLLAGGLRDALALLRPSSSRSRASGE